MANTPYPQGNPLPANGTLLPQPATSFAALSAALGTTPEVVCRWVRGARPVPPDKIPYLTAVIDARILELNALKRRLSSAPPPAPKVRGVAAKAQQGKTKLHKDL